MACYRPYTEASRVMWQNMNIASVKKKLGRWRF